MRSTASMFASSHGRSLSPAPGTTRSAPDDNQAYAQPPQSHQSPAPYAMTPTQPSVGPSYGAWRGHMRCRATAFFRRCRQQHRGQYGPLQSSPQQRQPSGTCQNCTRIHPARMCSAYGQICRACGKRNHFVRCCRSTTAALHNVE